MRLGQLHPFLVSPETASQASRELQPTPKRAVLGLVRAAPAPVMAFSNYPSRPHRPSSREDGGPGGFNLLLTRQVSGCMQK